MRAAGSPAHAGMAPARHVPFRRDGGFPRPRGDGPEAMCHFRRSTDAVPPPTRGWPPLFRTDRCPRPRPGSPAHAGMAPSISVSTAARSGSPAHAGMAPPRTATRHSSARFPRPRGDGPAFSIRRLTRHRFPRPRGDGPCVVPAAWYSRAVPPPTAKPNPLTF